MIETNSRHFACAAKHGPNKLQTRTVIEDAFAVFEYIRGKSLERKMPVWFAHLGLTKAFDQLSTFRALLDQAFNVHYF